MGKDIDADGDLDLVWIEGEEQKTAVVLINDGNGNFTEAKDNTPYAAELKELLSSSGLPDQHCFQTEKKTYTLTPSPFRDIASAVNNRLAWPTVSSALLDGFDAFPKRSAALRDLRKRGPPIILSKRTQRPHF